MKIQIYSILLSLALIHSLGPEEAIQIVFLTKGLKVLGGAEGEDFTQTGNSIAIQKSGEYVALGESEEGNIIITANSVTLYLQNLILSSKKNSPIIVTKNLKDVKIIILENTILNDLEDKKTTTGECCTIKVGQNSTVLFENKDIFTLNGECKEIIKGGKQASIIFKKPEGEEEGEYRINAKKTAIDSDGLIQFDGGIFTIKSEKGDAIKSQPSDSDKESKGKILIKDGTFNVNCFNDAFTAKNNIEILKGKFNITTEKGYDSKTYNETESSKGFKLTNNETGCGILIHSGEFIINTADDAFRSNRDLTILSGNFNIKTKDDAICAKFDLVLGQKNAPSKDLFINIEHSYEALEGMTVTIYSGKIICKAEDDGINASSPEKEEWDSHGHHWNISWNQSQWENRNRTRRNNSRDNPWGDFDMGDFDWRKFIPGAQPNDSYVISIQGGELYLYTDSDGIDSNGHIFLHGGNIYIFSEGQGPNEPIDHNGNFTLFNTEVLGVGTKGLEYVHKGIQKGNQKYAFHSGVITKDKKLEILDENEKLVKNGEITKDINYIFYSSLNLNENYKFYLTDEINKTKTKLNMTFGDPKQGEDDEDIKFSVEDDLPKYRVKNLR